MMMREQHMKGDASVRGGARKGELNVRISYKFSFPPWKLKKTAKQLKTVTGNKKCVSFLKLPTSDEAKCAIYTSIPATKYYNFA